LFFGEARDIIGQSSLMITIGEDDGSIASFLQSLQAVMDGKLNDNVLIECDSGWKLVSGYKFMINKRIIDIVDMDSIILNDGDEIGILPPFAGG